MSFNLEDHETPDWTMGSCDLFARLWDEWLKTELSPNNNKIVPSGHLATGSYRHGYRSDWQVEPSGTTGWNISLLVAAVILKTCQLQVRDIMRSFSIQD